MDGISITGSDFIARKAERPEARKPKDSDFLRSHEPFARETRTQGDFRGGIGERYELKRPEASDIWKVS